MPERIISTNNRLDTTTGYVRSDVVYRYRIPVDETKYAVGLKNARS